MNYELTQRIKQFAFKMGADLVGIANIERFDNAPIMMSPKGIMPTAKSVIVCAVHHPDAAIELGGEPEPQDIGPYSIQYIMNDRLDMLSYHIANELDKEGYHAIPIASSNIWRYRPYKELSAIFAPDMSHIYAAVAAGLSELGWNGLSMTPEYGTRNRFISIITEAVLEPTPLYNGTKLCDMCGECIRTCPTDAYRKEVNGVKDVIIEGKNHKFANKNLWRCAWAEHFDLDLNLDIPDVVNEDTITENVKKYGIRGGEFGVCLRVCLPKHLRVKDPDYTRVYRRKRHSVATDLEMHRGVLEKASCLVTEWNIDHVCQISSDTLKNAGINIKDILPDGHSVLLLADEFKLTDNANKDDYIRIARFNLNFCAYDIVRRWEELGYTAMSQSSVDCIALAKAIGLETDHTSGVQYEAILCSGDMPDKIQLCKKSSVVKGPLAKMVKRWAKEQGADMIGIAPASRVDDMSTQLRSLKENGEIFSVKDQKPRFYQYDPIIDVKHRHLKTTTEYIPDSKSVIVLGLHYPQAVTERTEKLPAEAVGPYVFVQYESQRILGHMAYALVKHLQAAGYEAVYSFDPIGIGTMVGSPRGPLYSKTCCSIEAVAAGLAMPALNANAVTKEYGTNQNFVAIITNAPMETDPLLDFTYTTNVCDECGRCINSCPVRAIDVKNGINVNLEGQTFRYPDINAVKCEWSTLHALVGDDGFKYIGSKQDERPDTFTPETLTDALKRKDPIQKHRPVTAELCVLSCPFTRGQDE